MSCRCNLGVMGSESKALGSGAGGKGNGLGRLECMGSQPLNRSSSLEKKGMELGVLRPICLIGLRVDRKRNVGEDFGHNVFGLVGGLFY